MAFDMQQLARRESMLAMAVNLPPPLSSSPYSAPSAPSAADLAAPSPLQRRRLPPPHALTAPSSSSLQLPASSSLAFFPDIASISASNPAATPASAASNRITTTAYTNSFSPTTTVRGQTRLPSFAAVTAAAAAAAAAADSSSTSSPLWPPPITPLDSSPSSASVSSSYTLSHPVLPPLPTNLPQESSPSYLPWTSIHHHFSGLDPLVSLSAPLNTNANISTNSSGQSSNSTSSNASSDADSSDTPAHFSTPSFNHFPALTGSQPLSFWPAYDSHINLPSTWNESALAIDRPDVSAAINPQTATPLPPLSPNSPSSPDLYSPGLPSPRPFAPQPRTDEAFLLQEFDIHSDIDTDFGDRLRAENLRARARARALVSVSTLATFSATSASAAAAPTVQQPAAPRQRHRRAIQNQASPPALLDGFALPRTVAGAFNGIFDEPEDIPHFPFPLPLADAALPPLSSPSTTMPATSTARRRSRRQTISSETLDDSTSSSASTSPSTGAAHGNKRQRIVPLGADANQHVIDDDDDSLFGDSKSVPVEDYTTIDLTEAVDVPEELKKPKVDNRTKLSGFQCVICMDDVTGLTLTHCGHLFCAQCLHSSLNIDSTRGKCPMCRTKIDMKARDNYTNKTKGYWPLELKLMTRTRQGKRKAQAMA